MGLTLVLAAAMCAGGLFAMVVTRPEPRRVEAVARKRPSR